MKKTRKFFQNSCVAVLGYTLLLGSMTGCGVVLGKLMRYGYDEVLAASAISNLASDYIYIDFHQIFPDTYRFDVPKKELFKIIVRQLKAQGEVIMEQDLNKGIIYTAAKEAIVPERTGTLEDKDKIFYQHSIYLTPKGRSKTYVTSYPTILKGSYQEVTIPFSRNMLRGIFFGALAAEIYPEAKKNGLIAAKERNRKVKKAEKNIKNKKADSKEEVITHVVVPGDTLGKISKMYTGNVMNYKKIAEYNNIKDIAHIKTGQVIKIPAGL